MTEPNPHMDALADRYMQMVIERWAGRGLPLNALAAACATWGLQYACAEATPGEVAEGLHRMADALLGGQESEPTHLI